MASEKYRGLIFDGALVPGVMSGAITVTSRVMKEQPEGSATWLPALSAEPWLYFPDCSAASPRVLRSPFRSGETRYVKEAWRPWGWREDGPIIIEYADGARRAETGSDDDAPGYEDWYESIAETATLECERKNVARDSDGCYHWQGDNPLSWRSSLFLPRYCARTWVEILSVKPARCQEITEEEILASGVRLKDGVYWGKRGVPWVKAIEAYENLWDDLNARRGFPWSGNWWTWRCTFRRCEKPKGAKDAD